MDLTYFNPHSQSEADFLANFVARQDILDHFVRQLRNAEPGRPARHHLIVAPRGYGKTALLRRIAIAARVDIDRRERYIALTFREEQHNVISLDVFWRNCLQSLLEAREDEGAPDREIEELEAAWERLVPRQTLKRGDQDGEPAWHEFLTRCQQIDRRPLLLIDNLDTLLEGLEMDHQWTLRRILQRDDGPMLIAAAPRYPESTHDPSAAFYEFFRVHTLSKLSDQEVMVCLRALALQRGESGRSVLTLLDKGPGRIASLNTMAGGNPRTLSVLYSVLESHMSEDVLSQLSAMLDTFTGWYQARTEEMPMQARAVFDALALNWDPITAARLSEVTGLETSAVSSQLSRLEKGGFVETVSLSRKGKGRNAYQVSERFFNIWYLMRNGPRRARQNIKFLTVFLQSCFSGAERRSLAQKALAGNPSDPRYSVALASSLRPGFLREQLLEQAKLVSNRLGQPDEYRGVIQELRQDERYGQRAEPLGDPEHGMEAYDDVIRRFGDAPELALREQVAMALDNKGDSLVGLGQHRAAEAAYRRAIALKVDAVQPWVSLGNLLLDCLGDTVAAIASFEEGLLAPIDVDARAILHANYAYALALHGGDAAQAGQHVHEALANGTSISPAGRELLEALLCLNEGDGPSWPMVFERIGRAVNSGDSRLWTTYLDDVQRVLWFIVASGEGESLRRWMEKAEYQSRYAPLYHALVAAIDGEDHLLSINPETRQPATRIYEGIARRLRLHGKKGQRSRGR